MVRREVAFSINHVPIYLEGEFWCRICGYYEDVLETIERPDLVLLGRGGTLIAVRELPGPCYYGVTYREVNRRQGYVISATYVRSINHRAVIWRRGL